MIGERCRVCGQLLEQWAGPCAYAGVATNGKVCRQPAGWFMHNPGFVIGHDYQAPTRCPLHGAQ